MNDSPALTALLSTARALNWPRHYAGDLELDREKLAEYSGPFAWAIRETGTDLLPAGDATVFMWALCCARYTGPRWFWWDGAQLEEVGADEALNRLYLALPLYPVGGPDASDHLGYGRRFTRVSRAAKRVPGLAWRPDPNLDYTGGK